MDIDFFEARVYGAVLDLLHETHKAGCDVNFRDDDHYKIMMLVRAGVELRDFEHAMDHRPEKNVNFQEIASWALTVAAVRKQQEGEG